MTLFTAFAITAAAFLLVVVGMAVGVLMGRRQISGSCGGLASQQNSEGETSCSLCSDPDAACRELANRQRRAAREATAESVVDRDFADEEDFSDVVDSHQVTAESGHKAAIDACKRR